MTAQELMVGDLVTFKDCVESGDIIPIRIEELHGYDNTFYATVDNEDSCDELLFDDEICGIPLTPEILEKNGFEFGYTASEEDFCSATGGGYPEEKGWCYDEGFGEIKIIFPNQSDGGLVRLDDQSGDRHLELVFVKPLMVHELQRALQMCEIEKNIVL